MLNLNKAQQMKHITSWDYYSPKSKTMEPNLKVFSPLVICCLRKGKVPEH